MPCHHPLPEILHDYATGKASEAISLVVSTHLAMCTSCCDEVARQEAIGGALLADIAPAELAEDSLQSVMACIDKSATVPSAARPHTADIALKQGDILIPQPLRDYLPAKTVGELDDLKWSKLPGFAELSLPLDNQNMQLKLMRISAGVTMPKHTHNGTELTLVLHGGYSDESGNYGPGDLAVATGGHDHAPRADDDGDCICLIALEAPLRFTGFFSRFLNPFNSF